MEIHKPRSVHSFREFLSEIAVVVVSIAIALSGEQLIEHLHNRHKAAEARAGIRDEIVHNLTALSWRAATQKCIDQRIEVIAHLLDESTESTYVAPNWLSRPLIWEMVHARWQVALQAGWTPLLASDEQVGYGFIYAIFADIAADEDHEQLVWARLRALEGLAHPSTEMRDRLRVTLQEARYRNFDIKQLTKGLEDKAGEMGIVKRMQLPPGGNNAGICFPTTISRVEALQRVGAGAHQTIEEP